MKKIKLGDALIMTNIAIIYIAFITMMVSRFNNIKIYNISIAIIGVATLANYILIKIKGE